MCGRVLCIERLGPLLDIDPLVKDLEVVSRPYLVSPFLNLIFTPFGNIPTAFQDKVTFTDKRKDKDAEKMYYWCSNFLTTCRAVVETFRGGGGGGV